MKLEEFDYHLPKEFIAQFPCERRDESRLMALNRKERTISHRRFFELPEYLKTGDVIVLNNTKVIPARLFGRKTTGGLVEVLLIHPLTSILSPPPTYPSPCKGEGTKGRGRGKGEGQSQTWRCLISPGRGLKNGSEIFLENRLKARIVEKGREGIWIVEFIAHEGDVDTAIEKIGLMPLPPYIKREQGARVKGQERISELDKERYQTIFAKEKGAIAAPTAGLHFTNDLLEKIGGLGVETLYITLHTGLGTFMPVKEEDITKHRMAPEYYKIDRITFDAIKQARAEGRRIIAVGSTVTRALETMVRHGWEMPELNGSTGLFIYPGYRFNAVDALITNFHLPKSTLIMLTAAFAGREFLMTAYNEAVKQGYRFFSYGDAMMVV